MKYSLPDGKKVNIPDKEIEKLVNVLGLSQEEAIQVWLDDEKYTRNAEQEELEQKAKENRITATIHQASAKDIRQKTQKERVKKENPTKEMVIARIAEILPEFAENIEIVNSGKLISFTIGENSFEIDLKQKRKPKK